MENPDIVSTFSRNPEVEFSRSLADFATLKEPRCARLKVV